MLGSFRVRLIIAFIALFAAVSVTVSFAGMLLREQQVRTSFDRELLARADLVRVAILREPTIDNAALGRIMFDLPGAYFRDFYVQVLDSNANIVAKSASLGNSSLPVLRPFADTSYDNVIVETSVERGLFHTGERQLLRGLRTRFKTADGKEYIAIIAADPQYVNDAIRVTRWLFLGGNIGGLAAAWAAAWFVTGAWSRRLEELVGQIERVNPDNLTHRIEIRDRDEISDLAKHLNAMLDRLRAGFDTQERFIHDASHELKTPVATVQAEAQALLLSQPNPAELMEFVRGTNDEMRRLGRLTEALLLLTRTSDRVLLNRFTPLEISEAMTAAIRHLSTMATDHQVRLTLETAGGHDDVLMVRCDPDLLEAMISNLIRNAIRFSPRSGEVRIRVAGSATDVTVSVEDEGPGIPEDILGRIFDRYFETSQTRVRRGAGLGLAIASTVARLHGGSISAANRESGGARFVVVLPRYQATV
jgi:signal transduction histidine kinase